MLPALWAQCLSVSPAAGAPSQLLHLLGLHLFQHLPQTGRMSTLPADLPLARYISSLDPQAAVPVQLSGGLPGLEGDQEAVKRMRCLAGMCCVQHAYVGLPLHLPVCSTQHVDLLPEHLELKQ